MRGWENGRAIAILFREVKGGLNYNVAFEKRLKRSEGACLVDTGGTLAEMRMCKGLEAATCLVHLRNSKETKLAGEERVDWDGGGVIGRKWGERHPGRKRKKGKILKDLTGHCGGFGSYSKRDRDALRTLTRGITPSDIQSWRIYDALIGPLLRYSWLVIFLPWTRDSVLLKCCGEVEY